MKFTFFFLIIITTFNNFCSMWNLDILEPQNSRPQIIDLKNKLDAFYAYKTFKQDETEKIKGNIRLITPIIRSLDNEAILKGNLYGFAVNAALKSQDTNFEAKINSLKTNYFDELKQQCEKFLEQNPLQQKEIPSEQIKLPENHLWDFSTAITMDNYQTSIADLKKALDDFYQAQTEQNIIEHIATIETMMSKLKISYKENLIDFTRCFNQCKSNVFFKGDLQRNYFDSLKECLDTINVPDSKTPCENEKDPLLSKALLSKANVTIISLNLLQ